MSTGRLSPPVSPARSQGWALGVSPPLGAGRGWGALGTQGTTGCRARLAGGRACPPEGASPGPGALSPLLCGILWCAERRPSLRLAALGRLTEGVLCAGHSAGAGTAGRDAPAARSSCSRGGQGGPGPEGKAPRAGRGPGRCTEHHGPPGGSSEAGVTSKFWRRAVPVSLPGLNDRPLAGSCGGEGARGTSL